MVKWLSQQTFNLPVPGSNPSAPTILKHIILTDNTVTGKLRLHFSVFQYGITTPEEWPRGLRH